MFLYNNKYVNSRPSIVTYLNPRNLYIALNNLANT